VRDPGRKVRLELRRGRQRARNPDEHIIAATGYKVDLERLPFLSPEIARRSKPSTAHPCFPSGFESSITDLYFVGVAAANSFGPVLRFAFGAASAARRLTRAACEIAFRNPAAIPAASVATAKKKRGPQAITEKTALDA